MRKSTVEDLQKRIRDRWGDVKYEIIDFGTSRDPITIKCLTCGETFTLKHRNNLFNKAKKSFCTYCSHTHKNFYNGNKENFIDFKTAQQRLEETFNKEYEIIENSYQGWSKKCLIRHNCGKIFSTQPRYLFHHSHCPCLNIVSKGENKIKKFLQQNNIEYEEQKRLEGLKKAPYDFYLPKYNLLIEFQGRQHYEPVTSFGGEKQFIIQQEIDERKRKIAKEQNFKLLCISYKDINLIEQILVQRLSLTGVDSSESKYQPSPMEN